MSLELAGLKARFVRMAFEEFIMNHYTAKSSRSDVHHDWLTYADKCFASSSCSEYQSHLFSELNVSHFYHKHVKDSNKKRKLKKTIAEFKSLIDSLLGALFDNPNNFKDITFDNHKTIGEWYRNMQCRLISPHQHKKSLLLKHQRINPRTSSKGAKEKISSSSNSLSLPVRKQRQTSKKQSRFLPEHVEASVLLLETNIPISTLYIKIKQVDQWRLHLEAMTDAQYAQIAAPTPSTARRHVFETQHHVQCGFAFYLKDPDTKVAFMRDGGSLRVRNKESVVVICLSFQISKSIPHTFVERKLNEFACLYRSSITNDVLDSENALAVAESFKSEVINNDIHGIEFWLADGKATEGAAVKVLRSPLFADFRAKYHIPTLLQYIKDYLHNWYNAYNNAPKAITSQGASDAAVGGGALSQFMQLFNELTRVKSFKERIHKRYIKKLPEIQNVQRFCGTAISCSFWTEEPNTMLNVLNAVSNHVASMRSSDGVQPPRFEKFELVQHNLQRLSFRMLILAMSVIGKCVAIPVIRAGLANTVYIAHFLRQIEKLLSWHFKLRAMCIETLSTKDTTQIDAEVTLIIEELESKSFSKCKMHHCSAKLVAESEHSVCTKCQDKYRVNEHIPRRILNLLGPPIDDQINAYKHHRYLFEAHSKDVLSEDDELFIAKKHTHSAGHKHKYSKPVPAIALKEILAHERTAMQSANLQRDPDMCFALILMSVMQRFTVLALKTFDVLFGFSVMPVLLIDEKWGSSVANVMVSCDKEQYLRTAVKHIGDTGKYGKNVRVDNIQSLVNESLYDGLLKMFDDSEYGCGLYQELKRFAELGGSLVAMEKTSKLRRIIIRCSNEIRVTWCVEHYIGKGKKQAEQATRYMPMLQAKLTLPHNALKCLSAPSYAVANPRKYKLSENDEYFLDASKTEGRRGKRNRYNVLQPTLRKEQLQQYRKEISAAHKARMGSKATFIPPAIDFESIGEKLRDAEPERGDWERGCCMVKISKVNDKFDVKCTGHGSCGRVFHPSCLKTRFKIKASVVRALRDSENDWLCPVCQQEARKGEVAAAQRNVLCESSSSHSNSNQKRPRRGRRKRPRAESIPEPDDVAQCESLGQKAGKRMRR